MRVKIMVIAYSFKYIIHMHCIININACIDCIDYVTGIAHGGILRVPSMLYKMASIQADI